MKNLIYCALGFFGLSVGAQEESKDSGFTAREERERYTFDLDVMSVLDDFITNGATISEGATIWIEFSENPTTGYEWIIDESSCADVIWYERSYEQDETEEDMMGVGGTTTIMFQGWAEGNCTFRAANARSWEFDGFDSIDNSMDVVEIPVIVTE